MAALRTLASFVSRRSAALVAASVFALWELKAEMEAEYLQSLSQKDVAAAAAASATAFAEETRAEMALPTTSVAFNGSVIEYYPAYRANCQQYLDDLVGGGGRVDLVPASESSLLGAAVALACLEEGKAN